MRAIRVNTRSMAKVSVIIPHYEDLEGLRKCLAALDAQTYSRSGFEIVVGDNNSPFGPQAVEAVIAGRAKLVVVTERGAGPARKRRRGRVVRRDPGLTDSDCVPEPQWLSAGLTALADYDS
jgi:glycosyltransferase involved in cell wall biosynthesis